MVKISEQRKSNFKRYAFIKWDYNILLFDRTLNIYTPKMIKTNIQLHNKSVFFRHIGENFTIKFS